MKSARHAPDREALRRKLSDPVATSTALGLYVGAKVQSRGLMICCPWHDDSSPSCSITTAVEGHIRVHCFACGAGGDVFSLIARVRGLDVVTQFPATLAAAAELVTHIECAGTGAVERTEATRATAMPVETFDELARTVIAEAPLRASTEAYHYLLGRNLPPQGVTHSWGALPLDPSDLQRTIAAVITKVGQSAWTQSGLCAGDGTLTFPSNVLIIPWRDAEGRCTTLQRRRISGEGPRKYVFAAGRSPMEPYGIEQLRAHAPNVDIALVEGAVDAVAYAELCQRHGKQRVVLGLPGASSWRPTWSAYAAGRVVRVALDADEAGDRAAGSIAKHLYEAGARRVLRQRPIGGKDWAALLVRSAP